MSQDYSLTYRRAKEANDDELIAQLRQEDYGLECVLDLNNVDQSRITVEIVRQFAHDLCDVIDMVRGPIYHWGENEDLGQFYGNPKMDGISCVQFVHSSSITIHALDLIGKVFVNVFSCKDFDPEKVKAFALEVFGGDVVAFHSFPRK